MRWAGIAVLVASLGAGTSLASPAFAGPDAQAKYEQAAQLAADDENDKALALVEEGLKEAPKDLKLLQLKGDLLLKTRDFDGALAAYQAYVDGGATGANRRAAQKIVAGLSAGAGTFLDITATNGPATIYLDSKTQGTFCSAAPNCKKSVLPGDYKVIAERPGFERWSKRISVEAKATAQLEIKLIEKPSPISMTVTPDGARVTVDGKPGARPTSLAGGDHDIVIELDNYATEHRTIAAHEGKPVELAVSMSPLVPITVAANATLTLDGAKISVDHGGLAVPSGAHVLLAHAAGYHDTTVAIPADRAANYKLDIALRPIGAMIDISGAPKGATLVVDGKAVKTAADTSQVEVPPGQHHIELIADGYIPFQNENALSADQTVRLGTSDLHRRTRRGTYISAAITGVGVVTGTVTSFLALSRNSDYDKNAKLPGVTVNDPSQKALKSDGQTFALMADVGFGVAIIGAAALTYYYFHEGRGKTEESLHLSVGPGSATLSASF